MKHLNLIRFNTLSRLNVNLLRVFLIVFSITIAIICLTINSFVSYAADEANLIQFSNTDKNTVILDVGRTEMTCKKVDELGTYFSGCKYNYFNRNSLGVISIGQQYYSFESIEVGKLQEKMVLPSLDQYGATENTQLINGRLVNDNDIMFGKNAILVHKAIGKFIFGEDSNLIGEKMQFYDQNYNSCIYEIVGVLMDTPDIKRTVNILASNDNLYIGSTYKLPIILDGRNAARISNVLLFFDGEITISTLRNMRYSLDNSFFQNIVITNAEEQMVEKNYYTTNNSVIAGISLNIVMVILCLTSVIIIFFSIKERANEIAVRKSFGATTCDILAMFLSEIVVCIFISICYALPISTLIMAAISNSISARLFTPVFPLNIDIFLSPMVIISLAVCVLSIIPVTIFAKSKIINCLKVS